MFKINSLFVLVIGVPVLTATFLPPLHAQGNPIPLNWRGVTAMTIETYGNNNTKPLTGAKVTIDVKEEYRHVVDSLKQIYPVLQIPQTKTSQTRGAMFSKLPPSSVVGPYVVTVDPKPFDNNNEYTCNERNGRETYEFLLAGAGPNHRLNFNFKCEKTDIKNEFERRRNGGFDLSVKLKESGGTRGNGYWVQLNDKDGKRVKKVRTGGNATAVFKNIDPSLNSYTIEVYKIAKLVHSDTFDMPEEDVTHIIDLDNLSNK